MSAAYWIDVRTGKAIEIGDHARHVASHPGTFGLTKAKIDATGYKGEEAGPARDEVCRMAMRKGWIRMRQYRHDFSFQHEWRDLFDVYGAVVTFLKDHRGEVGPHEDIRVLNVASGAGFQGTTTQFLDAFAPKKGVGIGQHPEVEPERGSTRVFDLIRQHIYQQAGIVGDAVIPYDKHLEMVHEAIETVRAQGNPFKEGGA